MQGVFPACCLASGAAKQGVDPSGSHSHPAATSTEQTAVSGSGEGGGERDGSGPGPQLQGFCGYAAGIPSSAPVSTEATGAREGCSAPSGSVECHIDFNRSGATVALDYFAAQLHQDSLACSLRASSPPSEAGAPQEESSLGYTGKEKDREGVGRARTAWREAFCRAATQGASRQLKQEEGRGQEVAEARGADGDVHGSKEPRQGLPGGGAESAEERGARIVRLFELVEDGDLWRWEVPGSRESYAGLGAQGTEFDAEKNPRLWEQVRRPEGMGLGGKREGYGSR